jgi:hypothetical protein
MTGTGAFLMKDVVLFGASFYLLKQDLLRLSLSAGQVDSASEFSGLKVPRRAKVDGITACS